MGVRSLDRQASGPVHDMQIGLGQRTVRGAQVASSGAMRAEQAT